MTKTGLLCGLALCQLKTLTLSDAFQSGVRVEASSGSSVQRFYLVRMQIDEGFAKKIYISLRISVLTQSKPIKVAIPFS